MGIKNIALAHLIINYIAALTGNPTKSSIARSEWIYAVIITARRRKCLQSKHWRIHQRCCQSMRACRTISISLRWMACSNKRLLMKNNKCRLSRLRNIMVKSKRRRKLLLWRMNIILTNGALWSSKWIVSHRRAKCTTTTRTRRMKRCGRAYRRRKYL